MKMSKPRIVLCLVFLFVHGCLSRAMLDDDDNGDDGKGGSITVTNSPETEVEMSVICAFCLKFVKFECEVFCEKFNPHPDKDIVRKAYTMLIKGGFFKGRGR